HARQYFNLCSQLTNVRQATSVDTHLVGQNTLANDVTGYGAISFDDLVLTICEWFAFACKCFDDFLMVFIGSGFAFLFVTNREDFGQTFTGIIFYCVKSILLVCHEQWDFNRFFLCALCKVGLSL